MKKYIIITFASFIFLIILVFALLSSDFKYSKSSKLEEECIRVIEESNKIINESCSRENIEKMLNIQSDLEGFTESSNKGLPFRCESEISNFFKNFDEKCGEEGFLIIQELSVSNNSITP